MAREGKVPCLRPHIHGLGNFGLEQYPSLESVLLSIRLPSPTVLKQFSGKQRVRRSNDESVKNLVECSGSTRKAQG